MTTSSPTATNPAASKPAHPTNTRRRNLRFRDEFGVHRGRPFLSRDPVIVTSTIDHPPVAITQRRVYLPV